MDCARKTDHYYLATEYQMTNTEIGKMLLWKVRTLQREARCLAAAHECVCVCWAYKPHPRVVTI